MMIALSWEKHPEKYNYFFKWAVKDYLLCLGFDKLRPFFYF